MYGILRKVLFTAPPEVAHELALESLRLSHALGADRLLRNTESLPVRVMGLKFPNPIGLAAGMDKNGDYIDALGGLGFGFIEVGTVTPRPQTGNPKPRLFRLETAQAMINRLGFNNKGVDHLTERVRRRRYEGILGINIGKNFDTPNDRAGDDYLHCLEKVYPHADYVTVNISSPNTEGLRDLQAGGELDTLLAALAVRRRKLADEHGRCVPIAVKVAPDLNREAIRIIADTVGRHRMDAVIATNTTVSRTGVQDQPHAGEAGGLSGRPLFEASNRVLAQLRAALPKEVALIGVGGVMSGKDAVRKTELGADLVQLYTGFVYRGPGLIPEAVRAIRALRAAA
jgi:dihydroorotate dehydrogenase